MRLAIVGWGSVGKSAVQGLSPYHDVVGYDIDGRGDWSDVLSSEVSLVCVSTDAAADGKLDMSNVHDVAKRLATGGYEGLVIVKSTLQPGTMDRLEKSHPFLRLVYMPEFLREKDAVEWFANPDRLVVSGEDRDVEVALSCFEWVPESIPRIRMKHLEAELGKLAHNAYIATKVTFTCEIERICHSKGANPIPVMETVWTDRRVNNHSHLTPGLGGFDGKCVPKDTSALACEDEDPESLIKVLHSRGSKGEVSKREEDLGATPMARQRRENLFVGTVLILGTVLCSLVVYDVIRDWEDPVDPVHMIWEGGEVPPSGSIIFLGDVQASETTTRTYHYTTCSRDYGSETESCDTTIRTIPYFVVYSEGIVFLLHFPDFDEGFESCMVRSCDVLGMIEMDDSENLLMVLDMR